MSRFLDTSVFKLILNCSHPFTPTLMPATWHPNVILSANDHFDERPNIVDAMNVSPAPSVSTTFSGGKDGLNTRFFRPSWAQAPSTDQGQITVALKKNQI